MKYCWDHVDEMLEYRVSLGYSLQPMKWYLLDFSRYLKAYYPNEIIIRKEMVTQWCEKRDTEKNYSYRSRISALRQFTLYLKPMGYSDFILDTGFLPPAERYTPYIFTDRELNAIFKEADSYARLSSKTMRFRIISVIFRLIYFCGLRPNEGGTLAIADIDLTAGTIFIRKNKAHSERLIPMADDVTDMMRDYLRDLLSNNPDSEYVFPSPSGKPYAPKWLTREFLAIWNKVKDENNIAHVRVYDLRHRWATAVMMRFINSGEDLFTILPYMSSYMGHRNFEDTAYYIHLLPENLLKSAKIDWGVMEDAIPEVLSCE